MKRIIAIFLCLGLLSANLQDLVIMASFKLNQAYIAKNLCIEKNIKNSKCEGNCQLVKELKKSKEQNAAPTSIDTKRITLEFILDESSMDLYSIKPTIKKAFFYSKSYSFVNQSKIFHPPQAV